MRTNLSEVGGGGEGREGEGEGQRHGRSKGMEARRPPQSFNAVGSTKANLPPSRQPGGMEVFGNDALSCGKPSYQAQDRS